MHTRSLNCWSGPQGSWLPHMGQQQLPLASPRDWAIPAAATRWQHAKTLQSPLPSYSLQTTLTKYNHIHILATENPHSVCTNSSKLSVLYVVYRNRELSAVCWWSTWEEISLRSYLRQYILCMRARILESVFNSIWEEVKVFPISEEQAKTLKSRVKQASSYACSQPLLLAETRGRSQGPNRFVSARPHSSRLIEFLL